MVTSCGKREPTGNKVHNIHFTIFLGVFFSLFQTVKTCFFLMNYIKFVSTAHANEWIVCCVSNDWGITETVPRMCPISGRPERWHFWLYIKLNTIKLRHRTMILCISSILYLFIGIYSTSMQASDTCYCTIQMKMYRENELLAQAHIITSHMKMWCLPALWILTMRGKIPKRVNPRKRTKRPCFQCQR